MKRTAALAVVLGFAALAAAAGAVAAESCCFVNDRFSGMCTVRPGQGETCQSALDYLNNPMSSGKSYCGGTSVRGGWIQVDCKTGKPLAPKDEKGSLGSDQCKAKDAYNLPQYRSPKWVLNSISRPIYWFLSQ
jgi:hypothetical protein